MFEHANLLLFVAPQLAPQFQGEPIKTFSLQRRSFHQTDSSSVIKVKLLSYLCHVHQLAGQLLDFILTRQHVHVILVRPAIQQQPRH